MIRAIVGANWGDEGKGKITDMCAEKANIVVRFQGGANAGHTIINQHGKFALHQLPSGVFYPDVTNVIAGGVALDARKLRAEIESVTSRGLKFKLRISDRVGLVMPYHIKLDTYEDERRGDRAFGSTKSGIAPFYSDKYAKVGVQAWMLYDRRALEDTIGMYVGKLAALFDGLYGREGVSLRDIFDYADECAEIIKPYIDEDIPSYIRAADRAGETILMEGQLGALRDVDHGIYPFVTSSNTLAAYSAVSCGIAPGSIKEVLTVAKAYSSAVGAGAFVVNLTGEEGDTLRRLGGDAGEYGATTGRPRSVGYFDAVATRHGVAAQGSTSVALTALDCLGYLEEIPVCVAYELDGQRIDHFPNHAKLERCKPIYEKLPGWNSDIRGVTDWDQLPAAAQNYVKAIEKLIETPVSIVSTGPKRHEIIFRQEV